MMGYLYGASPCFALIVCVAAIIGNTNTKIPSNKSRGIPMITIINRANSMNKMKEQRKRFNASFAFSLTKASSLPVVLNRNGNLS